MMEWTINLRFQITDTNTTYLIKVSKTDCDLDYPQIKLIFTVQSSRESRPFYIKVETYNNQFQSHNNSDVNQDPHFAIASLRIRFNCSIYARND